jgi:hypothetical protein
LFHDSDDVDVNQAEVFGHSFTRQYVELGDSYVFWLQFACSVLARDW